MSSRERSPWCVRKLGKADGISMMEIEWPSGTTQKFGAMPANQAIEISEGENIFRKREYKPIALPKP